MHLSTTRVRSTAPGALLALVIVLIALQRGGYFSESWGLPTAGCAWAIVVAALLGDRQRIRRAELLQLASLGLLGVLALVSGTWAPGGLGSSLPEAQLLALYVTALTVIFMMFRGATALLSAVWASLSIVSLVALAARLFPSATSGVDAYPGNRLSTPIGYWNSLGLWAAMAVALSIVLAARARPIPLRILAGASCVPCAATLYFTYSRGAWISLAAGVAVALALDPRRLGIVTWIMLVMPWAVLGIALASSSSGLTSAAAPLAAARHDGQRLAIVLAILSVAAGTTTYMISLLERRWRASPQARRAFANLLVVASVLGLAGAFAHIGAPWTAAINAAHRFSKPASSTSSDLNERLFEASGSGRVYLWRVAWDDARRHPLTGSGAGSYASEWFRNRTVASDATNAHQLYLETLAEVGPVGLGLLIIGVGTPLIGAWRGRRHPLAAGATAAYVAFLVHVAVDWDWQLAAVALAALSCSSALLIMARASRSSPATVATRASFATCGVALACFALWSLHGSLPLGHARDALDDGRWGVAEKQASLAVAREGGFSSVAWRYLGEAQIALKNPAGARRSLRVAVRRDPASWEAWYDLATVAQGVQRSKAAARALALNPHGLETQALARVVRITPSSP